MLVEMFAMNCDYGLYTLQYHLLDRIVEDIRRLGSVTVLDSSPHEHLNMHIKQGNNRILQRKCTRLVETEYVMERTYVKAYN